LCQARNAGNAPTRSYYAEGEFVLGSPGQAYYCGVDQIGSARRVFASTSTAPAYGYDPYGNPLQVTAPLTDFGYAGMFADKDSGLNLTLFRAYDPVAGRWLSRDPIGESSDQAGNLYTYAALDPIANRDSLGLIPMCKFSQDTRGRTDVQTIADRVFAMKTGNMNVIAVYRLDGGLQVFVNVGQNIAPLYLLDISPIIQGGTLLNDNRR
jgi:RHS repeat-associated protein